MEADMGKKEILELLDRMEAMGLPMVEECRRELEIAEMTGSKLLSNIDNKDIPFIKLAAKNTGYEIYIEKEAFSRQQTLIKGMAGVHTRDVYKDHGRFWDEFSRIKQ